MCRKSKINARFLPRFSCLAAFVVLTTLALTGCNDDAIVSPASTRDEPATRDALTTEERALLAEAGISASKVAGAVSRAAVYSFEDPFGTAVGTSLVIRHTDGLSALLRSTDLTPGEAVTMWMVLFNAPENCTDNACGEDDLTNPAARVDIVYADGKVIRSSPINASWRDTHYFARRRVGDTDGSIYPALFGTPALGLENARKAEVHLVLRTHGPVLPGLEQEMISTFAGGCKGFPDALGKAGPNTCLDIQFAVHQAGI